jgi:Small, acid-soluble spore proteins, alpha/beta type.
MPEEEKIEIAKELGVYEKVKTNGWADVSSKDCGNIVKKALELAERDGEKK